MRITRTQADSIYGVIVRQHLDIRRVFQELASGSGSIELLNEACTLLTGHERGEEVTLFADLMHEREMRVFTLQMAEEHHLADVVMSDLLGKEAIDEHWMAKAKLLSEVVDLHLSVEERDYLPHVQAYRDDEWARRMAVEFERQEQAHAGQIRTGHRVARAHV